jgi:hypothetical protein
MIPFPITLSPTLSRPGRGYFFFNSKVERKAFSIQKAAGKASGLTSLIP